MTAAAALLTMTIGLNELTSNLVRVEGDTPLESDASEVAALADLLGGEASAAVSMAQLIVAAEQNAAATAASSSASEVGSATQWVDR